MQAMAECSGPPQSACADALGTFYPSLETGGFLHPAFCTPIPMHASTPLILRKSRMRRRARTDLCGGRSAMVVPTATVTVVTRWDENAGLRRDAIRSQVIDALEAQGDKGDRQ